MDTKSTVKASGSCEHLKQGSMVGLIKFWLTRCSWDWKILLCMCHGGILIGIGQQMSFSRGCSVWLEIARHHGLQPAVLSKLLTWTVCFSSSNMHMLVILTHHHSLIAGDNLIVAAITFPDTCSEPECRSLCIPAITFTSATVCRSLFDHLMVDVIP